MRSATVFALIAVMVLGIYILPSVTAKFAGSHSWEVNLTARSEGLKCGRCHVYIRDEMAAAGGTNVSNDNDCFPLATWNPNWDVVCSHISASRNTSFVGTGMAVNITADANRDWDTVCHMCHVVERGASVGTQHTRVTTRVCTDCHGNSTSVGRIYTSRGNSPWGQGNCTATAAGIGNCSEFVVGPRLASSQDLHSNFFVPLDRVSGDIAYEDTAASAGAGGLGSDGNYTAGWYACLGCHTHVGIQMTLYRSNIFNFSITATETFWNASRVNRNTTSVNVTSQAGFYASKWY